MGEAILISHEMRETIEFILLIIITFSVVTIAKRLARNNGPEPMFFNPGSGDGGTGPTGNGGNQH